MTSVTGIGGRSQDGRVSLVPAVETEEYSAIEPIPSNVRLQLAAMLAYVPLNLVPRECDSAIRTNEVNLFAIPLCSTLFEQVARRLATAMTRQQETPTIDPAGGHAASAMLQQCRVILMAH
mmetsp:Transcript_27237/g.69221  ORF Transcript_27237/g.69221 Transcript_27237/m.69221 type:complete len:121 (-) Transcript_27237:379-741(-)